MIGYSSISESDKERIRSEQSKAWMSISTMSSLASLAKAGTSAREDAVEILLNKIESEKKRIDKFIDSIPDLGGNKI